MQLLHDKRWWRSGRGEVTCRLTCSKRKNLPYFPENHIDGFYISGKFVKHKCHKLLIQLYYLMQKFFLFFKLPHRYLFSHKIFTAKVVFRNSALKKNWIWILFIPLQNFTIIGVKFFFLAIKRLQQFSA